MYFTQGDSGGPATCYHDGQWTVVGVASWVRACDNAPTAYTRTSFYLDWIEDEIAWYEDRMTCGTKPPQQEWVPPVSETLDSDQVGHMIYNERTPNNYTINRVKIYIIMT